MKEYIIADSIIAQVDALDATTLSLESGEAADISHHRMRNTITDDIYAITNSIDGCILTGELEQVLVRGKSVLINNRHGYYRYYIRPKLLQRTQLAYPATWVDRLTALVEHRSDPILKAKRTAILTRLMVAAVTTDEEFTAEFEPGADHRSSIDTAETIAELITEQQYNGKQVQSRVASKMVWLITYLLDCYQEAGSKPFTRSLFKIIEDSDNMFEHPQAVSRILEYISYHSSKCVLPIFTVRKAPKGWPGSKGSTFYLKPEYAYLAAVPAKQLVA